MSELYLYSDLCSYFYRIYNTANFQITSVGTCGYYNKIPAVTTARSCSNSAFHTGTSNLGKHHCPHACLYKHTILVHETGMQCSVAMYANHRTPSLASSGKHKPPQGLIVPSTRGLGEGPVRGELQALRKKGEETIASLTWHEVQRYCTNGFPAWFV